MSIWLRQLELGPMKNFVYLVGVEGRSETAVIDPAWDADAILEACEAEGRKLTHALITHRHFDHCNAVPDLLARGVRTFVHEADRERLAGDVAKSELTGVRGGDLVDVGGLGIRCIHTPGHTAGSQCFHIETAGGGALVSGDTVFVNACGRCNFDDSSPELMFDSLHRVLGALPDSTTLYPGHDYGDVKVSSLGRERTHNPYFQTRDLDAFLALRMPARR